MDPNMWWTLMGNQQYGQQQGGQQQGGQQKSFLDQSLLATQNPWIEGGKQVLSGLSDYFGGMDQRNREKHWFEQAKDMYDQIRWGSLGKDVVSPNMLSMMANRNRTALGPTRANMSYATSRAGGLRSGQSANMFQQNYLPIEAEMSNQNQQWGTGMNVQNQQFLQSLLTRLTGK